MDYIPAEVKRLKLPECAFAEANRLAGPAIIRRVPIRGVEKRGEMLVLKTDALEAPLSIEMDAKMKFDRETVTAMTYFTRVIEPGDMIDAVVLPQGNGVFPMTFFWIHIQYVGTPSEKDQFRKKEDGLFALRTKAGEKGERLVTRQLRDKFGHSFPPGTCDSPGYFEIRYAGKKMRKPDRKCSACGMTFEIKRRNKDKHLRVSHSDGRPFASENALDGWHAFVFPDMTPHFLPNAAIAQAIADGNFIAGDDGCD
jgi:hypothetical protein